MSSTTGFFDWPPAYLPLAARVYPERAALTDTAFDRVAYTMENCFSIVLLIDLLATKIMKMQTTIQRKSLGESKTAVKSGSQPCHCGGVQLPPMEALGSQSGTKYPFNHCQQGDR